MFLPCEIDKMSKVYRWMCFQNKQIIKQVVYLILPMDYNNLINRYLKPSGVCSFV